MLLTVYSKKGEPLFSGTKQDCKHFIKCKKFSKGEVTIGQSRTTIYNPEDTLVRPSIETTAPIESKPKGFWKRVFK